MSVLAPVRPAPTVPTNAPSPPLNPRPEAKAERRDDAKSVVCLNALDITGEACRKLARRGYDWA